MCKTKSIPTKTEILRRRRQRRHHIEHFDFCGLKFNPNIFIPRGSMADQTSRNGQQIGDVLFASCALLVYIILNRNRFWHTYTLMSLLTSCYCWCSCWLTWNYYISYELFISDSFNFCLSVKTINPSFNKKCLPPLGATSEIAMNQRTQKTIKEIYLPFIHFFDIDNCIENGGDKEEEEK